MSPVARPTTAVLRVAAAIPGALLLVSFADDTLAGPLIAGLALAWRPWGDLVAIATFTALSVGAALLTRWGMRAATAAPTSRLAARLSRVRNGRLARRVMGWLGDGRPVGNAAAAVVLGCVAPVILIELGHRTGASRGTAVVCGIAYGVAFAATYGAAGRLLDLIL